MKKRIKDILLVVLVFSLCLSGCADQNDADHAPLEETEVVIGTEKATAPVQFIHLESNLSDYLSVNADVIYPKKGSYASYRTGRITISPEEAATIFFPNDSSTRNVANQDEWRTYSDGDFVLATKNGNEFHRVYPSISYCTAQRSRNMEIEDLLFRYAEAHPEASEVSLDYMSRDDAITMGKEAIERCGVSLTPKLNVCQGLTHEQIIAWQQELRSDPNSFYDEFGKAPDLSSLTSNDDAYWLQFTFVYEDVPVFGPGEPSIWVADEALPPMPIKAEVLITRSGIQDMVISPAYSIVGEVNCSPIISPEEALQRLKESYDSVILTTHYRVISIYLEYVPIESNGETTLTPYWCFILEHENIREDGSTYWSDRQQAERFNAYTGKNLAYGG